MSLNLHKNDKVPSRIIGVQFSMLSPDEIRRNSVIEITSRDTYINNKPQPGGLFDPRMGVLEPGFICPTDGLTYIHTPGYFGHIELSRPVFWIQHIKEIVKILKSICYKCSKLKINKKEHDHILKWSSEQRWQYVTSHKNPPCGVGNDGCGCKSLDKIKLEGMATINGYIKQDGEDTLINFTPELILKLFKRISNDDVSFMGLSPTWSRPEWMVCEVLPVPPPAVRPSVKHDAQQRSEDDLTQIYCNILKTNKDLGEKIENKVNSNIIEGLTDVVQYFVAMIVNNKVKGTQPMAQRSGRPLNCIMGRLNSKYGRIRGNLMGKRVDYSARSVITGDPNLSIKQLGVPLKIAMNITKPVQVNEKNKNYLLQLVRNGPDNYPGAKILERKTDNENEHISLRYAEKTNIKLYNGDIVHRHMMDGDAVLFNRQPSLHRMSMMCHIVKIMKKGDTFRMNVGVTKPYNADFDGDEMNMHMPQNIAAETELRNLAAIPYQIISPAKNSPIIGIFQDSMLGSYRFTRPDIKFTHREAMRLLMMYSNVDVNALNNSGEFINSFDILSQIMPPITLKKKTNLFEEGVEDVSISNNVLEIRNGKYIRGQLDKDCLGSTTTGIIHRTCNDFGNMTATNFIDNLQNVVTEYMKTSCFSVGISDLIADIKTQDSIIHAITTQKQEVQSIIDKVHAGTFENNTSATNNSEFETSINNVLNKATEQSGKIGRKSLSKSNRFLMIVNSGSKGSLVNISQMISCLGQTNVEGKRIPYGFDDRTLPHYSKYDDSPNARGFIENSYITGLTASELFFHAMGGRLGLIDTAVKTSQTGYIQRRLIKGLEDLKIEYDMTVRNNKGKIVQFAYGDDGFDSVRVETQTIQLVEMTTEDIYLRYDIIGINDQNKNLMDIYARGTVTRVRKQKTDAKKLCKLYIEKMINARTDLIDKVFQNKNDDKIKMPVAFQFIINNIQSQLNLNTNTAVDITPLEAFKIIEEYYNKLKELVYIKPTPLFEIMYFYHLTPKNLLITKRFHRKALILLLETIELKYKQAIVHPGEMVGVIAGQSIGEPTTQLTLNTFHLSGVASKSNVTRGVPRIEEILRLTKNPKNPSATIFLKEHDQHEKEKATKFANMIEYTKLIDIVNTAQICFDPNDENTNIEDDNIILEQYYEFENMIKNSNNEKDSSDGNKSKWVIRLEFDNESMLEKNITMDDIHFTLNTLYGEDIFCVYSDYNHSKLIFRIRLNPKLIKSKNVKSLDQSDEIFLLRNYQESILNNTILRGINGVTNVMPRKLQNYVVRNEGSYTQKDLWILDTTGTNLIDIFAFDFIDYTRTFSNDIKEIFDVLGIEAARQTIYNEFVDVMDFSGVYINYHHLSLLCDRMTSTKSMTAIFRSGILNDDTGPISKSTFEVHTEVLLNASRHAEFDDARGVSANVMLGQMGLFGTGACQLILDIDKMKKLKIEEKEKLKDDLEDFDIEYNDNKCSKNLIEIKNNVNTITSDNLNNCDDDYDMGF